MRTQILSMLGALAIVPALGKPMPGKAGLVKKQAGPVTTVTVTPTNAPTTQTVTVTPTTTSYVSLFYNAPSIYRLSPNVEKDRRRHFDRPGALHQHQL